MAVDVLVLVRWIPKRLNIETQQTRLLSLLRLRVGRSWQYSIVVRYGVLVGLLGLRQEVQRPIGLETTAEKQQLLRHEDLPKCFRQRFVEIERVAVSNVVLSST
jgi:hypothetical protein